MISPGLVEPAWQAAWGTVISHQKTHRASQGLGSVLSKNTRVYVSVFISAGVLVCPVAACESGGGCKWADRSSLVLLPERSFLKAKWIMSLDEKSSTASRALRKMCWLPRQPPQFQGCFPL